MKDQIKKLQEEREAAAQLDGQLRVDDAALATLRRQLADLLRRGQHDKAATVARELAVRERGYDDLADHAAEARANADRRRRAILDAQPPDELFRLLAQGQAIALLPVRLETRFREGTEGTDLLVRIYPDDIHAEVFEPELTTGEIEAGQAFWRATLAVDEDNADAAAVQRRAAWALLAAQFTAERAAWIAQVLTPEIPEDGAAPVFPEPPQHKDAWTRAPLASSLPDRWIVLGYRGGERVFAVPGQPVPDPLPVGLSPEAEIPDPAEGEAAIDPGIRWMFDFDMAEKLGMGVRVPLGTGPVAPLDLLLVLGVKASMDERESAKRLANLLDGHHYSGGLSFVRQGSPTNNTGTERAAFNRPDAAFSRSFAIERGEALYSPGDGSNGDITARALGLDPSLFSHVANADLSEQRDARCMNAALWHSTWGYFLEQIMAPTFNRDNVDAFRRHFVDHVRGRGPLPVLRVANQPYGLLPVTSMDGLNLENAKEMSPAVFDFVRKLRDLFWKPGIGGVPRVGAGQDSDSDLLEILGMEATSLEYAARPVFGGHYFRNWWAWQALSGFADYERQKVSLGRAALQRLGVTWSPRALELHFLPNAYPLNGPRVQAGPNSETDTLSPNYISWLLSATPRQIHSEEIEGGAPNTLLYMVLRHAALTAYGVTAFRLLARFGQLETAIQAEPEMLNFAAETQTLTVLNVLDRRLPELTENATLADFLHERHDLDEPETRDYSEFWAALECLEDVPSAALERLLSETLDLCSHRLDAWMTSFASHRLQSLRNEDRSPGIHLGGFGWVENLAPAEARRSEGYLQAPSLQHATAAAVLRSGYLTHADSPTGQPLAIDLSSARTRLALGVLDAVRQGQPLGAVLGYRFERGLHETPERELDRYILPLRNLAPLVAHKIEQADEPAESVAAHNVVDGLALQRLREDDAIPWGQRGLPALGSADEIAVSLQLAKLDDIVDAVSDALTAESVYQAVRGNPTRSGAVLDAISRGEAPPPELEVVNTVRSGIPMTHRLLLLFASEVSALPDWPQDERHVRARAEPRIDAWLAELLGAPQNVRCRVEYLDAQTADVLQSREIRLSELALSPLDVIHIVQLDDAQGSELERRLAHKASNPLPAAVPDDATLRIIFARDPAWGLDIVDFGAFAELVRSLRELVSRGRALDPPDVVHPGAEAGDAYDTAELRARADAAVERYRDLALTFRDLLSAGPGLDTTSLRNALIGAAHFGLQGSFPLSSRGDDNGARDSLTAQADSVEREMSRRLDRVDELETNFERATAGPGEQRDHDLARLAEVLGQGFRVLPRFFAASPGELQQAFAASVEVQGGDGQQAVRWLQRVSRVRSSASTLHDSFNYADALSGTNRLKLHVGQLPFQPGDRWIALPVDQDHPPQGNRLSLVAELPDNFDPTLPLAGLSVDEWTETMPSKSETTGVTFHADQPGARAPNAILLAVPPDPRRPWDLATLENILLETFELAKLRAVDTQALAQLGQFLPALFFASNARGETVSTDFTLNHTAINEEVG